MKSNSNRVPFLPRRRALPASLASAASAACFAWALAAALPSAPRAQKGLHIQMFACQNPYANGKDSVLTQVNFAGGKIRRWAQVDLVTKQWRYVNDTDFKDYLGIQAMKSATEGLMAYTSNPNKMWKTTDGWKSYTQVTDPIGAGGFLQIKLTDAGYVGRGSTSLNFSADGMAWSKSFDIPLKAGPFDSKGDFVFMLSGGSQQYVSTDGGKTFTNQEYKGGYKGSKYLGLKVISADTISYATDLALIRTVDGGKTAWTVTDFPVTIHSIWWRDTKEVWVQDEIDKVRKSTDGGSTWKDVPVSAATLGDPPMPNLAVGEKLFSWPNYESDDGGDTWKAFLPAFDIGAPIFAMDFRGSLGVIGKSKGGVFFTTDGGRSFTRRDTVGPQDVMALKILSNGTILAGDRNGQVFTSPDTGKTWTNKLSNGTGLNAIKFQTSSDESVILMNRNGQPVVSTDHGQTFDYAQVAGGNCAQTVKPNGDLIQAGGTILNGIELSSFTAKGTRTPVDTISGDEVALDMTTINATLGYLVTYSASGKECRVHKTTNGWASVTQVGSMKVTDFPIFSANARIQAIGEDTVLVYSDGKTAYFSSFDGGKTFAEHALPVHAAYPTTYPTLKRAFFFNGKEAIFSLNEVGVWMETGAGAGSSGIRGLPGVDKSSRAPVAWYDAEARGVRLGNLGNTRVDAKVFDCFGRSVLAVPGHKVDRVLKLGDLPNGLYFVSLRRGEGKVSVARVLKR